MQLNQKETSLLKDLKEQEQICVEKYTKYSNEASDTQLKDLLSQIAQSEKQHLETVTQIMNGSIPSMQSGGGVHNLETPQNFAPTYSSGDANQNKQKDTYLCTDLLSTEKYVSATYNTSVFEFRNSDIRNTLSHIQKEEQQHGELLFNYMNQNGMYNA